MGSSRILGSKDNSDRLGYLLENIGSNLAIETLKKQGKTQHQAKVYMGHHFGMVERVLRSWG